VADQTGRWDGGRLPTFTLAAVRIVARNHSMPGAGSANADRKLAWRLAGWRKRPLAHTNIRSPRVSGGFDKKTAKPKVLSRSVSLMSLWRVWGVEAADSVCVGLMWGRRQLPSSSMVSSADRNTPVLGRQWGPRRLSLR